MSRQEPGAHTGRILQVEPLVATACARVDSDDFGGDSWREGLERLVLSLNTEAALNETGMSSMTDQILACLVNRLQIERCYARHPEIADQQIVAPLFGLGLPRTGSTALSFLLAQDPARRSLRVWEAQAPCPPPVTATEGSDERIAAAQRGIDVTNELFPGLAGMLPSAADGPIECLILLALDFKSLLFEGMARVPTYSSWLMTCDMVPAYRYHERVLKLLQWRCPPTRWSLKTPAHMLSIDALDSVYPDARFVMTHRRVGDVLASVCALYETFISILADRCDPIEIGMHNSDTWRTAVTRVLAFRDRGNESRFHDLFFASLQRDPLGEIARLYDGLGEPLSESARLRMSAWAASNAEDRRAPGQYPAARFGLDPARIAADFEFYHDRFHLSDEH